MELYVDELGVLLDRSSIAIVNLLLYSLCMALVLRTENGNLNRVGFSGCVL